MKKAFSLAEVMVAISVATIFITTSIGVVSIASQSVKDSRDFHMGENLMGEAESFMEYVKATNKLRYGDGEFKKCSMTKLEVNSIPPDCASAGFYKGRYILVADDDGAGLKWKLVNHSKGEMLDDIYQPTTFLNDEAYKIYRHVVFGGNVEVLTNLVASVPGDDEGTLFHRYIDIDSVGNYRIVVAYNSRGVLRSHIKQSTKAPEND